MELESYFLKELSSYTSDAILVTEAEHLDEPDGPKIVYCNEGFERVSGYTAREVRGLTPRILQKDETDRSERNKIRAAMKAWNEGNEDARARVTLKNKNKQDQLFWVELNLVPLWSPDYTRSYWAAIQRDVTEQVQREEMVRAMLDRETDLRQAQSLFLAKMSHELRTPLNAVIGFSDALLQGIYGNLPEEPRTVIRDIADSGNHMLALVGDLLDADSILRGEARTKLENLLVRDVMDYACHITAAVHLDKKIVIERSGVRHSGRTIWADLVRARQCLTNIMDNAAKHTAPGGAVTVETIESDRYISIVVTDTGPGMTQEEKAVALTLFGKVNDNAHISRKGLGLGLPITMQLMHTQNGLIDIHTQPGKGTSITLSFEKGH